MMTFIKENIGHILFYVLIMALITGGFYKVFVKDTSKTYYTAPADQRSTHLNDGARYAPFSCARIIQEGEKIKK